MPEGRSECRPSLVSRVVRLLPPLPAGTAGRALGRAAPGRLHVNHGWKPVSHHKQLSIGQEALARILENPEGRAALTGSRMLSHDPVPSLLWGFPGRGL